MISSNIIDYTSNIEIPKSSKYISDEYKTPYSEDDLEKIKAHVKKFCTNYQKNHDIKLLNSLKKNMLNNLEHQESLMQAHAENDNPTAVLGNNKRMELMRTISIIPTAVDIVIDKITKHNVSPATKKLNGTLPELARFHASPATKEQL